MPRVARLQRRKRELGAGGAPPAAAIAPPQANPLLLGLTPSQCVRARALQGVRLCDTCVTRGRRAPAITGMC